MILSKEQTTSPLITDAAPRAVSIGITWSYVVLVLSGHSWHDWRIRILEDLTLSIDTNTSRQAVRVASTTRVVLVHFWHESIIRIHDRVTMSIISTYIIKAGTVIIDLTLLRVGPRVVLVYGQRL